uniref:Uncharacterized protein n=1 Tax=Arundo donax TaxID=35708 RepID=A0A0A9FA96_ARUDO
MDYTIYKRSMPCHLNSNHPILTPDGLTTTPTLTSLPVNDLSSCDTSRNQVSIFYPFFIAQKREQKEEKRRTKQRRKNKNSTKAPIFKRNASRDVQVQYGGGGRARSSITA